MIGQCSVNVSITVEGNATFKESTLDLCTIEGIPEPDAKPVAGIMPNSSALPDNTCRPDANAPNG